MINKYIENLLSFSGLIISTAATCVVLANAINQPTKTQIVITLFLFGLPFFIAFFSRSLALIVFITTLPFLPNLDRLLFYSRVSL